MTTTLRAAKRLAAIAALLLASFATFGAGIAAADGVQNCNEIDGYSDLNGNSSGDWGSIQFTPDSGPLVLNVNDGYSVSLCIKKGSSKNGGGAIEVGPYVGEIEGLEIGYPDTDPSEGLSHYGYKVNEEPEDDECVEGSEDPACQEDDCPEGSQDPACQEDDEPRGGSTPTRLTDPDAPDDEVAVEGIVVEAPVQVPQPQPEAVEAAPATLPRTGVSSVATALAALFTMGAGTGLVGLARRRQHA